MANKRAAEMQRAARSGSSSLRAPSPATTARSETSTSSKVSSPTSQQSFDFQFLNFSHPSEAKAGAARKAVRSHVTRQQHQRESAAAARRAKSFQSATDSGDVPVQRAHAATFPSERPSTLELQTPSTSFGSPDASPSNSPQATSPYPLQRRTSPTDLYPVEWHPYIHRILEHYFSTLSVDIAPMCEADIRELLRARFFPFILTDPASLHTVLLVAASQYNRSYGSQSHRIDLLQLRGMAIREINSALANNVRATSDQLVAAVANMACYEALSGDRGATHTHMTALLRIVSLRGGLAGLGLDGILERYVLWIDSNAAHITGSRLYFSPSAAGHPRPDPIRFAGG